MSFSERVWSRDLGYPSGAGYKFVIGEAPVPPVELSTSSRLFRELVLEPPSSIRAKDLVFKADDTSELVRLLLRTADPPVTGLIASCDVFLDRDKKMVKVRLMLQAQDPGPDVRMASAIKSLWLKGFTTVGKLRFVPTWYTAANTADFARVCRVVTRSSAEQVREAFVSRCVPDTDILSVKPRMVKGTSVPSGLMLISLASHLPISRIPWKIPLAEPGECLQPRKVSLEGPGCSICRDLGHKQKQCPAQKEDCCGRCNFPFAELKAAGTDLHNHDCEGGPTGYGAEHLDLSGAKWRAIWTAWRTSVPAIAASEDPYADLRADTLAAARAASEAVRAARSSKSEKKKRARESGFDTPEPKQQQLEVTPTHLDMI